MRSIIASMLCESLDALLVELVELAALVEPAALVELSELSVPSVLLASDGGGGGMAPPLWAIMLCRSLARPLVSSLELTTPSPSVSSCDSWSEVTPSSEAERLPSPLVSFSFMMESAISWSIFSIRLER